VGPNLHNGIATLSVQLPGQSRVGDVLHFLAVVTDPSRVDQFENRFTVRVKPKATPSGHPVGPRKPPGGERGQDREIPAGISLPKIVRVFERDWERYNPRFDKFTALRIKNAGACEESGHNGEAKTVYDFFVNLDNVYLNTEIKPAYRDPEVTRARFMYGMVLVGLAMLQQEEMDRKARERKRAESEGNEEHEPDVNIEQRVDEFTMAVAPVLLPMIESLGELDEEPAAFAGSGDAA